MNQQNSLLWDSKGLEHDLTTLPESENVKIAIDGLSFELRKKFEGVIFIDIYFGFWPCKMFVPFTIMKVSSTISDLLHSF